jgi:hypothetical protein
VEKATPFCQKNSDLLVNICRQNQISDRTENSDGSHEEYRDETKSTHLMWSLNYKYFARHNYFLDFFVFNNEILSFIM